MSTPYLLSLNMYSLSDIQDQKYKIGLHASCLPGVASEQQCMHSPLLHYHHLARNGMLRTEQKYCAYIVFCQGRGQACT